MDNVFKPDIKTKNLCQSYYDYEVFRVHEREQYSDFEIIVWGEIQTVDSSARAIDIQILTRELRALNIELFGLAWFDHNWKLFDEGNLVDNSLNNLLLTEIWFTKHYLTQMGENAIREVAGFYNETIMQAAIVQKTLWNWSIPRAFPDYHNRGVNPSGVESCKKSCDKIRVDCDKEIDDQECCIRLANRFFCCNCWQDGIVIPQKLSSVFAQRISFTPNLEALLLLQRIIVGLYNNSLSFIIAVEQYGSYELAMKARIDLIQLITDSVRKDMEKQKRSD